MNSRGTEAWRRRAPFLVLNDAPYGSERTYNVETMLKAAVRQGAVVGVCGSCLDARAIGEGDVIEGAHRGSMDELTAWTLEADKVLTF